MNNKISILMAGYRKEKWNRVYKSILDSADGKVDFELVIVSPHSELPDVLKDKKEIIHIQDLGSPTRAAQIAAINAKSDILCFLMSDDGIFLPHTIEDCFGIFNSLEYNKKNILSLPYFEYDSKYKYKPFQPHEYYTLNYHVATKLKCLPDNWVGMNQAFLYKDYFCEMGGFDCQFEAAPMAIAELSLRCHRDKASIYFIPNIPLGSYSWESEDSGEHGPIFNAQTYHDEPLYQERYKNGFDNILIKIDINNWEKSDSKWKRRYNVE